LLLGDLDLFGQVGYDLRFGHGHGSFLLSDFNEQHF